MRLDDEGSPEVDRQQPFSDFAEVSLVHPVEMGGRVMPEGAHGIIMAVYEDGLAYEVEFESPFHVVLTLERGNLRARAGEFG